MIKKITFTILTILLITISTEILLRIINLKLTQENELNTVHKKDKTKFRILILSWGHTTDYVHSLISKNLITFINKNQSVIGSISYE